MLTNKMVGNKIAEARKKMNISQARLARDLFISSQAVGKWERGESMPDIITLNRLAEILGVDLNYFSESLQSAAHESDPGSPDRNQDRDQYHRMAPVKPLGQQAVELPSGNHRESDQEKKLSWDMSRGNWVDADFSGLKNLHEKFSSSNMQRCLFIGSELSKLLLKSNHVVGCDFSKSDLSSSHIQSSHLAGNLFKGCSLKETEFSQSHITSCDFSGADFTGAAIKSGAFVKSIIANAVWNRSSFIATQIADMVFEGPLEDCYFENCAFKKVTFRNSTLINTFFKNKSLKGIRFIDCQVDRMTYEFLKNGKADLTGVTLLTP